MYRDRLAGRLGGEALEYVSSARADAEMAYYDILGSKAHALGLLDAGVLGAGEAGQILQALGGLEPEKLGGDGSEDIHEAVEAAVMSATPAGLKMHTGRSRNDQVALDMRLKLRDDTNAVCARIADTAEAMVSVAKSHRRTVMPLYTHMQQAQAGTLSHYLLAQADALMRDLERFEGSYSRLNRCPLGAGPVGGTAMPVDRDATAAMLGFDGLLENSIDATGSRDFVAEHVWCVAAMMAGLSRVAEDVVVWSSSEFGFVELADELASPSSVMPQKKNPDVMELTRGKAAVVSGALAGVLAATKGLATGYGRDLQELKPAAFDASRTALGALAVVRTAVLTMSVNGDRMRESLESGYALALDIADGLVSEGMPFRTAHGLVGRLVQAAHRDGVRLDELEEADVESCLADSGARAGRVMEMLASATPESSLRARASRGSSGFAEQDRMVRQRAGAVSRARSRITAREGAVRAAVAGLEARASRVGA